MPTLPNGFTYELPDAVEWEAVNVRRSPDVTVNRTLGQPAEATFDAGEDTANDIVPQVGEAVDLNFSTGSRHTGTIQKTTQTYEDRRDQLKWSVSVADASLKVNRRLPIACYTAVSGNTAITNLFNDFTDGSFSLSGVQAGLGTVTVELDGSKTVYQALEEIASQLGAKFYFDGDVLHFFVGTDPSGAPAVIDENSDLLQHDPPVSYTEDITQLKTRVFAKGAGAKLIADVAIGDDTLFVDSSDLFDDAGGDIFLGKCLVAHYTGKSIASIPQNRPGGVGGMLAAVDNTFAGGAYGYPQTPFFEGAVKYGMTCVKNGVESTMSAGATAVIQRNISPILFALTEGLGGVVDPDTYTYYATTTDTAGRESEFTGTGASCTVNFPNNAVNGTILDGLFDARASKANIYRKASSGPYAGMIFKVLEITLTGAPTYPIAWTDGFSSVSLTQRRTDFETALVGPAYVIPGPAGSKVTLTLPLGSVGTTSRRVYRSDDNGLKYYLLTTINNNTTTSYVDTAVNRPVNFDFFGTNNWFEDFDTEVPGSLPDLKKAILTGVTGITENVSAGSDVNLWVQRDDTDAQFDIAAVEGGDGVHEYLLTDTTLDSYAKLIARADIELQLYSRPIKSVSYATRDPESKVGRTVTFDLPIPGSPSKGVFGDFLIQTVRIDQIHENDTLVERYTVTASSVRFTLQDLLQRVVLFQDNGSSPKTGFDGGGGGGSLSPSNVTESELNFSDVTTGDVTSSKHGLAPKSVADATKFLNSAATPTYAQVKDSDLSTSDVTTNNVTTAKHGFAPKAPNDATKYLDGTGAYSTPAGGSGGLARVLASNTSISAGISQIVSESLEVAAGKILEVEAGALLEILGGSPSHPEIRTPFVAPIDSNFAWVNQSASIIRDDRDSVVLTGTKAGSGANLSCRVMTAPATPYTITAFMLCTLMAKPFQSYGMLFRQSSGGAAGSMHVLNIGWGDLGLTVANIASSKWTSATAFSADYVISKIAHPPRWLRISDDGSVRRVWFSADGMDWVLFDSQSRTDFITADQVGFYVSNENSLTPNFAPVLRVCSWAQSL
jgi:hypothetical protein